MEVTVQSPPEGGGQKNPLTVFEGFSSLPPAGGVNGYKWNINCTGSYQKIIECGRKKNLLVAIKI